MQQACLLKDEGLFVLFFEQRTRLKLRHGRRTLSPTGTAHLFVRSLVKFEETSNVCFELIIELNE